MIILETARAHLQCSKVAEFKPARSCQSFAPLRHAHKGGGEGKLVNGSSHRRTQHVGLGAMWCEMNGGGVRKGGGRRESMRRSAGSHSSSLPPDLQVRSVYSSRENTASPLRHICPHLCLSAPPPEQLSATSGLLWRGVCVHVTTCHASAVCVCIHGPSVSVCACMCGRSQINKGIRAHYFCFLTFV